MISCGVFKMMHSNGYKTSSTNKAIPLSANGSASAVSLETIEAVPLSLTYPIQIYIYVFYKEPQFHNHVKKQ